MDKGDSVTMIGDNTVIQVSMDTLMDKKYEIQLMFLWSI